MASELTQAEALVLLRLGPSEAKDIDWWDEDELVTEVETLSPIQMRTTLASLRKRKLVKESKPGSGEWTGTSRGYALAREEVFGK